MPLVLPNGLRLISQQTCFSEILLLYQVKEGNEHACCSLCQALCWLLYSSLAVFMATFPHFTDEEIKPQRRNNFLHVPQSESEPEQSNSKSPVSRVSREKRLHWIHFLPPPTPLFLPASSLLLSTCFLPLFVNNGPCASPYPARAAQAASWRTRLCGRAQPFFPSAPGRPLLPGLPLILF